MVEVGKKVKHKLSMPIIIYDMWLIELRPITIYPSLSYTYTRISTVNVQIFNQKYHLFTYTKKNNSHCQIRESTHYYLCESLKNLNFNVNKY